MSFGLLVKASMRSLVGILEGSGKIDVIKFLNSTVATHSILDFVRSTPRRAQLSSCSTTGSSDCSSKSISIDQNPLESSIVS